MRITLAMSGASVDRFRNHRSKCEDEKTVATVSVDTPQIRAATASVVAMVWQKWQAMDTTERLAPMGRWGSLKEMSMAPTLKRGTAKGYRRNRTMYGEAEEA